MSRQEQDRIKIRCIKIREDYEQYILTIPINIVKSMKLKKGDILLFDKQEDVGGDYIVISRESN